MKVVFPKPDSPATIMVKAAPRFATILCLWFGRLAMPIGDAASVMAGAMVVYFRADWAKCGRCHG